MKTDIEIITFTLGGRDKYLFDCISRVFTESNLQCESFKPKVKQYIICQGEHAKLDVDAKYALYDLREDYYEIEIVEFPKNIGIACGINEIIPKLTADTIIKMDDDCKIISEAFFLHIMAIRKLCPNLVFSPFPVGLINNLGGPRCMSERRVVYSDDTDTYYTFRPVRHVGGFARVTPLQILKGCKFKPDLQEGISGNEDGQFSEYCISNSVEMAYLENAIIVEHNESTLGQHARYGETYFKGRF